MKWQRSSKDRAKYSNNRNKVRDERWNNKICIYGDHLNTSGFKICDNCREKYKLENRKRRRDARREIRPRNSL